MRGQIGGLEVPHKLGEFLPGLYQEDALAQGLTAALDEVWAPIYWTLDNFPAYLDPNFSPDAIGADAHPAARHGERRDFLDWLATWVGVTLDERWPEMRRRAFVAGAVELYKMRGTLPGLKRHVELFTGGQAEVTDSGGVTYSRAAGAALPGTPDFSLLVRVRADQPGLIALERLDAVVAAAKPAHVVHKIEVVGT